MVVEPALHSPASLDALVWRYGMGLPARGPVPGLATGFAELDRALPQRGWFGDGLNELLGNEQGVGEFSLLLPALKQVCAEGKGVLLANPPFVPYAPALAQAGLAFAHLIVVRQADSEGLYWAAEQALRSKACGAVVVWSDESARLLPDLMLRRLQVAAHSGACAGFLFRPRRTREQPSPAPLRIIYAAQQGALQLTLHKCRGLASAPPLRVQPWRHAWAARPLPAAAQHPDTVPHPARNASIPPAPRPHARFGEATPALRNSARGAAPVHPAERWKQSLSDPVAAGAMALETVPGRIVRRQER